MTGNESLGLTDAMADYINELEDKAITANEKTESHSNCHLLVGDYSIPIRVDDLPLLFIGGKLLPNMVNYLVNILPQFLYPYVVAYLQDLSTMREDPVTINEIYDFLKND